MKPLNLTIDGEEGNVFDGDAPGSVAFVPASAVVHEGENWRIDATAYFVSGWAEKNVRFSSLDGDRVFPLVDRPVVDPRDPRVAALVERLEHVYDVAFRS